MFVFISKSGKVKTMLKFLIAISFLIFQEVSIADSPPLLGHNLSSTSNVLESGQCTIGFLHAACGISDKLTLGTSPWIIADYKMTAIALRQQVSKNENTTEAFQVSYFKTFEDRREVYFKNNDFSSGDETEYSGYEMEAIWTMYIRSKKLAPHFTLHYNLHINYYFNEVAPFSFRRPYENPSPWQINASTLYEVELVQRWFIQGELGLLDIINSPLHTHAGVTIGRKWDSGYFYFGFSYTSTLKALFAPNEREDYQMRLITNEEEGYDSEKNTRSIDYDYSIHPELTIQFFF